MYLYVVHDIGMLSHSTFWGPMQKIPKHVHVGGKLKCGAGPPSIHLLLRSQWIQTLSLEKLCSIPLKCGDRII